MYILFLQHTVKMLCNIFWYSSERGWRNIPNRTEVSIIKIEPSTSDGWLVLTCTAFRGSICSYELSYLAVRLYLLVLQQGNLTRNEWGGHSWKLYGCTTPPLSLCSSMIEYVIVTYNLSTHNFKGQCLHKASKSFVTSPKMRVMNKFVDVYNRPLIQT